MKQTVARNIGWLLLLCLLAGGAILLSLRYESTHIQPGVVPIPENDVAARKARMINLLYPIIHQENLQIEAERSRLLSLEADIEQGDLPHSSTSWLKSLAAEYELAWPKTVTLDWSHQLLKRVDVIPADLALAQAATESAWGTSRFAVKGNNYFGIWCFTPGCGLVPRQRPEGQTYEVKRFRALEDNVADYMQIINTHKGYRHFRQLRASLRRANQPLAGDVLTQGLTNYSGIGKAYVHQLDNIIHYNKLERFNYFLSPTPSS